MAIIARTLALRVHAGAQLRHLGDHTATAAGRALLHGTLFTALAAADLADAFAIDGNLGLLPIVDLFKSALEWVHDGLALLGSRGAAATATSTTEHLTEQIVHTVGTAAALFETIFAIFVVFLTLFSITEHLVRTLNLLKLLLVTAAVRVIRPGKFMVRLLDSVEVGVFLNAENFVEFFIVYFFGRPTATHASHTLEITKWESASTSSEEHSFANIVFEIIVSIINYSQFKCINSQTRASRFFQFNHKHTDHSE